MSEKPPTSVSLSWKGDLAFEGRAGDATITLDGRAVAGPSPMHALALALAGCMAIDVVNILTRGRHPLRRLEARLDGHRADAQPPRYRRMDLHFEIGGEVPAEAVTRAIDLSREKYCSVWHSLRQDIEFVVTFAVHGE